MNAYIVERQTRILLNDPWTDEEIRTWGRTGQCPDRYLDRPIIIDDQSHVAAADIRFDPRPDGETPAPLSTEVDSEGAPTPLGSRAVHAVNSLMLSRCKSCGELLGRGDIILANVYQNGIWNRTEEFHPDCYTAAGHPHGTVQGAARSSRTSGGTPVDQRPALNRKTPARLAGSAETKTDARRQAVRCACGRLFRWTPAYTSHRRSCKR